MPETFDINIKAPLGGTVRNTSFQEHPPFSAFESLNFWPIDVKTGRQTYATRPGVTPNLITPGGSVVNMLCRVNGINAGDPFQSMLASFGGHAYFWNGAGWTAATGAGKDAIDTGRPVYATPFLQKVVVAVETNPPLVFNYPTGAIAEVVESAGTAPSNCRIAATAFGCVLLAGDLANPGIVYGSRTGDETDWDYTVPLTDRGGAWFTGADFNMLLSGAVTAIMPQTSDTVIISTLEGLAAMRGHPRRGGILDSLSHTQYVLGQGAWCKAPGDILYFMTPLGLQVLQPNYGAVATQVSRKKIPEELVGLTYDYANPAVVMEYDSRWNVIYIMVRHPQGQAWLFDPSNNSFHRLDYQGYPFCAVEYSPLISDTQSGVIFGGGAHGGMYRHNINSAEEFPSGAIIGPVKISQNAIKKNLVRKMRFVFGRDTPTSDVVGQIRIATGKDGQDAINRLYLGKAQYTADIYDVGRNDGVIYPRVAGHAMAIQMTHSRGSVVLEDIVAELEPYGDNNIPRSAQIPVTGEPVDSNDPRAEFDADVWGGYVEGTPQAPTCALAAYTHFVDLSDLPQGWWDRVTDDGRDIRATNESNGQIPCDVIEFDRDAQTGFITFKMDQAVSPNKVRIWVGNENVALPAADSDYGQYAAYDSNWKGFWPSGGGTDRTSNGNDFTMTGATAGDSTGNIGNKATDYGGNTNWYGKATASVPGAFPLTLVMAGRRADATTFNRGSLGLHSNASPTNNQFLTPDRNSVGGNARTQITSTQGATVDSATSDNSGADPYRWVHHAATLESATSRNAFVNGGGKQSQTDSNTPASLDEIIIGKGSRSGLSSNSYQGLIGLAQVHNVTRPDCWIDYQSDMVLDHDNFWSWGVWVEVNEPVVDAPLASACPLGFVDPTETGTWSGYAQATPLAPNAALERDWTHLIDLASMPNDWWTAVSSNGQDIRATNVNNIFIPLDLIEFNKTANTGLAVVKLTQSTANVRSIRLWVGNGSAVAVGACSRYGQYAAYDDDWLGFWPSGGGEDRTAYQHDLTATSDSSLVSAPSFGGVAGPIGNTATNYDGTAQYAIGDYNYNPSGVDTPLTFVVPTKLDGTFDPDYGIGTSNPTVFREQVSLGLYKPSPISSIKLEYTHGDSRTRMLARSEDLQLGSTATTDLTDLDTWRLHSGVSENSATRVAYVDGANELATSANKTITPVRDMTKIVIGTIFDGVENVSYLDGSVSLVSLHKVVRSKEWHQYHFAMLDQGTFWDTPWAWTADSNSLPQS